MSTFGIVVVNVGMMVLGKNNVPHLKYKAIFVETSGSFIFRL